MRADPKVEAAVISLLNEFSNAVSKRDVEGVLRVFASDPDVVSIGSEKGEVAHGPNEFKSFLKSVLSRPETYSWKWNWHFVSSKGDVAWVAADGLVITNRNGVEDSSPYRLTAVMERRNDRWHWMQFHGSEPVESWKNFE